jgi:DNA-directed RNA polymerase I, II, and III subunit RPABC2
LTHKIRVGPPKLTRFERARIVGARALQISLGAPLLVELPLKISDPIDIALAELKKGALPMTVRRTLPDESGQDIALIHLLN